MATIEEVLQRVTTSLGVTFTYEMRGNRLIVVFTAKENTNFFFWKFYPRGETIPSQHPAFEAGTSCMLEVKGASNVAISTLTVENIFPPQKTSGKPSWLAMQHPFRAEAKEFTAVLNTTQLLSPVGAMEVQRLLRAALTMGKEWIAVHDFKVLKGRK